MITTLFDDDTDIETEDEEGMLVVATLDSTCCCKRHRYDDDMITRRVRAKRSDNEQIKALTSHVIAQRRELTSLKQLITRRDDAVSFPSSTSYVLNIIIIASFLRN